MKFFRRASNDPEQRPKNVKKLNYQYDFIIVGKNIFVSSEVRWDVPPVEWDGESPDFTGD